MKKIGLFITAMICILALCACKSSDAPSGMQLVAGGKSEGYYFYAPEEWTVSNIGEIKSAYAARVDSTSISFARVHPEKTNKTEKTAEEYFFSDYFNDSLAEFPSKPNVTVNGELTPFGAENETADKAIRYVYEHKYQGYDFRFLQILIKSNDSFYIFTYSAQLAIRSDGKTFYDYYEDKLKEVMENFRFVDKEASEEAKKPEYKKDADGYILVSNADLAGFELYVPDTYTPEYSSAIVNATHTDGTNINMTEATGTGVSPANYWKIRKAELEELTGNAVTEIKTDEEVSIGNSDIAWAYEYKFIYNGQSYHVYQILAIEGPLLMQKGYVFTFTAKEENYGMHQDELAKIVEKVKFK